MPRSFILSTIAGLAVLATAAMPSIAASAPRVGVAPHTAKIGQRVTIEGSHLRANQYYALLIAVPSMNKPRARVLFGPVKSDGRGNMRARVRIPYVKTCGSATLYLLIPRSSQMPSAHLKVTGCNVVSVGSPPPPPTPGKKKKK